MKHKSVKRRCPRCRNTFEMGKNGLANGMCDKCNGVTRDPTGVPWHAWEKEHQHQDFSGWQFTVTREQAFNGQYPERPAPSHAVTRCLCGASLALALTGGKVTCACDALLWAELCNDGESYLPWVTIPEDSLQERRAAGKPVRYDVPEIVGWNWE
jgi:hypothetical protein